MKQFNIAETDLKLLCQALTGYRKVLLSATGLYQHKNLSQLAAFAVLTFLNCSPKDEVT